MNKSIEAAGSTIFKASLIVTGASTWTLGMVHTNIGDLPIIQFFGTLDIVAAIVWEWRDQHAKLAGKK